MKKYLFILLAAFAFVACGDEEKEMNEKEMNVTDFQFTVDENGDITPLNVQALSKKDLEKYIVGHGWLCYSNQRFNDDGTTTEMYQMGEDALVGIRPLSLYYGNDVLTIFSGINDYLNVPCYYTEETNQIVATLGTEWVQTILAYNKDRKELVTIGNQAFTLNKTMYINFFRRMTDDELKAYKEKYTNPIKY